MDRKKIYPIAACVIFVVLCTGMIAGSFIFKRHGHSMEQKTIEQPEIVHPVEQEIYGENTASNENPVQIPVAAPAGQNAYNSGYMLGVSSGKLQVIDLSTNQVYMDTEIIYEQLPENVRKSIDNGRYFSSLEEILAFLESYSS